MPRNSKAISSNKKQLSKNIEAAATQGASHNTAPLDSRDDLLTKQRLDSLLEDIEDYLYSISLDEIADSRRMALVEKADQYIMRLDEFIKLQLWDDSVRHKIRLFKHKLELRANNLCHLDDGNRDKLVCEDSDDDDDNEDDEAADFDDCDDNFD